MKYNVILFRKLKWATKTVLSPWLAVDEDRVLHVLSHIVWWKNFKDKKNLKYNVSLFWKLKWFSISVEIFKTGIKWVTITVI